MEINEIIIDRKLSEASIPSEDISRTEELWTEKHESFLMGLKNECVAASATHHRIAQHNKILYRAFAVPSICLPLIGGFVDSIISPELAWVPRGIVMLAAGSVALGNIANCGKLQQQHTQYAGLYGDLSQQIEYTLTRRKRSREACDVSMTRYIHKHQLLGAAAPNF